MVRFLGVCHGKVFSQEVYCMVNEGKVKSDEVRIVGGPNMWDLVIKSLAESQSVFFSIPGITGAYVDVRVEVQGLINLGPGNDWQVLGRVLNCSQNLGELFRDERYLPYISSNNYSRVYFHANYNCSTKTGEMRIAIIDQHEDSPFNPKYFPF